MSDTRRITVIGASGVIGRRLLPVLAAAGHHVRAASRSDAADRLIARLGAHPVRADILQPESLPVLVAGSDIVINLATSIPAAVPGADWTLNDRIRRDGTQYLIEACAGVPRLVQQSVAMLHVAADDRPQTETDPLTANGVLASALEMEATVQAAPLDWRIVRGALLYGEGTRRLETWTSALRHPDFRIPGDGSAWLSLIEVGDLARAFAAVALHETPRQIYIASDDTPIQYSTLFEELARRASQPPPPAGGPLWLSSFRVDNAKLRGTGWRPSWPSVWHALDSGHAFDAPHPDGRPLC